MSSSTPFRFKQFTIRHDRTAMKVGTDGVLLGAISGSGNPRNILEIGVGSGVVSMMLAQRFPMAHITGVEIDMEAWNQATENAQNSPWGQRIEFLNTSFQDYCGNRSEKFDLIVSNPPYFTNHLKSNDSKRNIALHNDALPFGELVDGVVSLLNPFSEFWVILPPSQMEELEKHTMVKKLNMISKTEIKDNPSKNILRVICGFSFFYKTSIKTSLSIKEESGNFSDDYSDLLKEFLIVF
jgi:tRNA1Val (adenine37-N6)-methyltransferase